MTDAALSFCVMFALESSSLWGMTPVMLGHAADNSDFQQGEVTTERASIIMYVRRKKSKTQKPP